MQWLNVAVIGERVRRHGSAAIPLPRERVENPWEYGGIEGAGGLLIVRRPRIVTPQRKSRPIAPASSPLNTQDMDSPLSELHKAARRAPLRALRRSTLEVRMADDKSNTGNPDRLRINTSEPYELRDWAKKLGITKDELRTAVVQVGNIAKDVERYLKHKGKR